MANVRWFHLSPTRLAELRPDFETRHREETSLDGQPSLLSVTSNLLGTEFLVKVDGANKTWRKQLNTAGKCLREYARDEQLLIFSDLNFYGPGWTLNV